MINTKKAVFFTAASLSVSLIFTPFAPLAYLAQAQTGNIVLTSEADFNSGDVDSNLDSTSTPGQLKLKRSEYTEFTGEQFGLGKTPAADILYQSRITDDGKIVISQDKTYNLFTNLVDDYVNHSHLDSSTNRLYISTNEGLFVVNLTDDTLVKTYTTTSVPAIENNRLYHSFLDTSTNRLYVSSYGGGLSVIDLTSDTLVKTYKTNSVPAIASNNVVHSFLDTSTNRLYVSSYGEAGGLSVIDLTNDTLVKTYKTNSVPAIANNNVFHSFLDSSTNRLYISTWFGGLSVIDLTNDTLVKTYNTTSVPAIAVNDVSNSFVDSSTNRLYVNTFGGGLSVIDLTSDTLVKTYNKTSLPAIASNDARNSFIDPSTNRLYVSAYGDGGLSVIDLTNDTLVKTYNTTSVPAIAHNNVLHSFLDTLTNKLYVSTYGGGLTINGPYNSRATFVSQPLSTTSTPFKGLTWEEDRSSNQTVSLKTRTGSEDAVWFDDFDDNDTSEYVGDYYDWGSSFNTAVESNGTIKLSNPAAQTSGDDQYVDFWFNTGSIFPIGSIVRARIKVNSNRTQESYSDTMFNDDWYSEYSQSDPFWQNNDWMNLSYVANEEFTHIGFDINWRTGTWDNDNDTFEIDWLSVELPDEAWGEWSGPCNDSLGCPITADLEGKKWVQYKVNLGTTDTSTTPSVSSVSLYSYPASGTFTSSVLDMGPGDRGDRFSAETTLATSTSIGYQFRTGATPTPDASWTSWTDITDTLPVHHRYGQIKAILSTTDQSKTPVLSSITITSASQSVSGSSSGGGGGGGSKKTKETKIKAVAPVIPTTPLIPQTPSSILTSVSGRIFTRNLGLGQKGEDIRQLQVLLNRDSDTALAPGVGSSGQETDVFGPKTLDAVRRFQKKYAAEILSPLNLSVPTGYVGKMTILKLNQIAGK